MKVIEWDGADVFGIPADVLRREFPAPEGGTVLLLVSDDGASLAQVANVVPGVGGFQPITAENRAEVEAALLATGDPVQAPAVPSAEEVAALRADLDWLIGFVTTGEV